MHCSADQHAAVVEALHHLREALALGADAVVGRHAHVVEEDRAAADQLAAEIVVARARDAGRVERHQEGA